MRYFGRLAICAFPTGESAFVPFLLASAGWAGGGREKVRSTGRFSWSIDD